jgi:hypothetical protein
LLKKAHLTKFIVKKFKIIESMGLTIIASSSLEYHYVVTKFHENLLSGSKVISGGQTDSRFGTIDVIFDAITTIQNCIEIYQSVQKVHPPQKFKRKPF